MTCILCVTLLTRAYCIRAVNIDLLLTPVFFQSFEHNISTYPVFVAQTIGDGFLATVDTDRYSIQNMLLNPRTVRDLGTPDHVQERIFKSRSFHIHRKRDVNSMGNLCSQLVKSQR